MNKQVLSILALVACGHPVAELEEAAPEAEAPAGEPAPEADGWSPSPEEDAVYQALCQKDPAPSCAQVEALASEPVLALLTVVERAAMPPWAGMHAAHCLVTGHADEVEPQLLSWVTGDDTQGLAMVVFGQLDALPGETALRLATASLEGPWAEQARSSLEAVDSAELRALVD